MTRGRKLLVTAAAVFGLMLSGISLADGGIGISVQEVMGTQDETVDVGIMLTGCRGMDSIQFAVSFDQEAVKLVGTTMGDLSEEGLHAANTRLEGRMLFAYACAEGLQKDSGCILVLQFQPLTQTGSAVTVSDVSASVYDPETDVQSKIYITSVEDGGVYLGEDGAVPEAVATPWIPETPTPSPAPTAEPSAVPSPVPEEPQQPDTNKYRVPALICCIIAVVAIIVGAVLIISRKKTDSEDNADQD